MSSTVPTPSKLSSQSSQPGAGAAAKPNGARSRVARGTLAPLAAVTASPYVGMFSEAFHRKWGRRLVTIPALVLATALYGALLPVLVLYALVRDTLRGRPEQPLLRFHLYIFSVLLIQCIGLALLQLTWLYGLVLGPERRGQLNLDIEIFFIPKTIALAEIIYGMDIEIEDIDCCAPGPILLFSRHASILDTILPIKLLGQAHGMGMRIVQKAELLWNPVVDVGLLSHAPRLRKTRHRQRRAAGRPHAAPAQWHH